MLLVWKVSGTLSLFGGIRLIEGLIVADSAPQQAAAAAMAVAFAVIPYCAARAIQELAGGS
jgi:hypothetical protein